MSLPSSSPCSSLDYTPASKPAEFGWRSNRSNLCTNLWNAAEPELSRFYRAVGKLFGSAAAHQAAELWLEMFEREEVDFCALTSSIMAVTTRARAAFMQSIPSAVPNRTQQLL
jgi:hypothetical protein